MHSLQVENGLSVAHASHFSHLHGEAVELQKRVCPFPQVVVERRMEKGLGHNIEPLQVFLGHVQCRLDGSHTTTTLRGSGVDTKDARKERPPMPSMSQTGKAYRLPCLHLFRISTTTFTTSPRLFRICSQALELLVWLCRDSFSMQAQALTLHNSGRIANSGRYSQTWLSISEEECEEMTSCLMNCFTRRDTVLKGPTRGWTHTGNRFDTTQTSWEGWNYIAFILIFLKKIRKREKSR